VVTVVPTVPVIGLLVGTFIPVVVVTLIVAYFELTHRRGEPKPDKAARLGWSMPAAALLERPPTSRGRQLTLVFVRVYLLIAVVLMIISLVKLGG
jgi:hypothetical protein